MMSAPEARTSSGCTPLIAACVPTGMKAGVRTTPCAVAISPQRAAPSVAFRRNENRLGMAFPLAKQQAGVAIRIKTVPGLDGMGIGPLHRLEAAECTYEHEQGRARQME